MAVLYFRNEKGDFVEVPTLQGPSAYEVAVANGFEGTEAEWLESLKPKKGVDYWTDADKAEIIAAVIAQLSGSGEYYTSIQVEGADYFTTPESTSGASPVLTITVGRTSNTNKLYFRAEYENTQLCTYVATSIEIVAFNLGSSYYYDGDSFTIGGETGQDTVVNITEINGF